MSEAFIWTGFIISFLIPFLLFCGYKMRSFDDRIEDIYNEKIRGEHE